MFFNKIKIHFTAIFITIFIIIGTFLLTACESHDPNTIKVGTIAGPETELMEVAQKVALEKYGLHVKIIPFTDYLEPNSALYDGSLDANLFQHQPWLDQQNKDHHYHLIPVGKAFIYPMGIYSKKIKTLSALPENATVAIPNDPSNEGRALLLLQKTGLIRLKANTNNLYTTPADIMDNPKKLNFKELDAAQLVRALDDTSMAAINTNYAVAAGLYPNKDAIVRENADSPYVNIIVIRPDELKNPRIKKFVAAYQSKEVADAAKKIFNGEAIPAW